MVGQRQRLNDMLKRDQSRAFVFSGGQRDVIQHGTATFPDFGSWLLFKTRFAFTAAIKGSRNTVHSGNVLRKPVLIWGPSKRAVETRVCLSLQSEREGERTERPLAGLLEKVKGSFSFSLLSCLCLCLCLCLCFFFFFLCSW